MIIGKGENSYGAYVPDVPGCVAAADTLEEVERLIQEAIEFHIEGMLLDGDPETAAPNASCYYVDIDATKIKKAARTRKRAAHG